MVQAVPLTNYHFTGWSDGSLANPRQDTNILTNIAVTANFAINTFSLSYGAGAHGSITGNPAQTVNAGANGSAVTATPASNYHFVSWSDGSTANPRTDTAVLANVTVMASFAINTFTLSYSAGSNGSLTGSTAQMVNATASGTAVTAVPNSGYTFTGWSDASLANPRTDSNVLANVNVTANFAMVPAKPGVNLRSSSDVGEFNNDAITSVNPIYDLAYDGITTSIQRNVDNTIWSDLGLVTSDTVSGLADGTHSISYRAMNGGTPSLQTSDTIITIQKTAPTLKQELINDLDTQVTQGTGGMILSQSIPDPWGVAAATFIDADHPENGSIGGVVTVIQNLNGTIRYSYDATTVLAQFNVANVRIRFVVRNLAGAQATLDSRIYWLW